MKTASRSLLEREVLNKGGEMPSKAAIDVAAKILAKKAMKLAQNKKPENKH